MHLDTQVLEEFFADHGLSVHQKTHKSWVFRCPACFDLKFYINCTTGRFICFKCADDKGYSGKLVKGLAILSSTTEKYCYDRIFGESSRHMSSGVDVDGDFSDEEEDVCSELAIPESHVPLDVPEAVPGVSYLEGRGIPRAVAMEYQIRYDVLERRVVFPVHRKGLLVGWQGRAIDPDPKIKILSSSDIPRDIVLMFQDRLRRNEPAILVEGPIDAIKCHAACPAVASMGKVVSNNQIRTVLRAGVSRIYIALDPDAEREAKLLVRKIQNVSDRVEVYRMLPDPGVKDLGEMNFQAVTRALARSTNMKNGCLDVTFR